MKVLFKQIEIYTDDSLEIKTFRAFPSNRMTRRQRGRNGKTPEAQKRLNRKNSIKLFRNEVELNFDENDYVVHLTYAEEPVSLEDAKKDIRNFFRRLKRIYERQCLPELKYIWIAERGLENGRLHFHSIITGGLSPKEIEHIWGKGEVKADNLCFGPNGVAELVYYLSKAPETFRRWNGSKNLVKPKVVESEFLLSPTEVEEFFRRKWDAEYFEEAYKDYSFMQCDITENTENGGIYIRALMRKREDAH